MYPVSLHLAGKVYHSARAPVSARPVCCAGRPIRAGRVSLRESAASSQSVWGGLPASSRLCASLGTSKRVIRVE